MHLSSLTLLVEELDVVLTLALILCGIGIMAHGYYVVHKRFPKRAPMQVLRSKEYQRSLWLGVALILIATAVPA